MTDQASPTGAPDIQQAKQWLELSLRRVINGGQKVVIVAAILLAASQIVSPMRYVSNGLVNVGDILPELIYNLCGVTLIFLVARWVLPKVLRSMYTPLLDRGRIIPVDIQLGPQPIHQHFTGQSTQPYMIRGAMEGMEIFFGRWLPTQSVNFRRLNGHQQLRTGFLYGDESLPGSNPAYALVDPRSPKKIWLIRQPVEASE